MSSESNDARLSKLEAHIKENRPLLDTVNHFSAKEFADLFTRSNELFMIVDCRSEAAYKVSHIPSAMTLVLLSKSDFYSIGWIPRENQR